MPASRRRSVLIVLALVLVVAGAGVTIVGVATREAGRSRLEALLAEHAAAGHGASYGDLVRSAPPLDRARQDRARAWMKANLDQPSRYARLTASLDWAFASPPAPPPELLELHEVARADMEELRELLGAGDLCLSALGWLALTPEEADGLTLAERAAAPIPNLLRVRHAAQWLRIEALLADDPGPALADIDRLHAALDHPGTLIDGMITVAVDAMRDETMLAVALLGRIDPTRRDAWLDTPSRERRIAADAWRGERLTFATPLARDLARGMSLAEHFGSEVSITEPADVWRWHVRPIFHAADEAALFLEGMLALEQHLRGEGDIDAVRTAMARVAGLGAPFDVIRPHFGAVLDSAVLGVAQSRATRAAAALAARTRVHGRRPADRKEARAWLGHRAALLDATDVAFALRYETVGEDRFRLAPDPDSARPDVLLDPEATQVFPWRTDPAWPEHRAFRRQGPVVEIRVPTAP